LLGYKDKSHSPLTSVIGSFQIIAAHEMTKLPSRFVHSISRASRPLMGTKEESSVAKSNQNHCLHAAYLWHSQSNHIYHEQQIKSLAFGEGQVGPSHSDNPQPPTSQIMPRRSVLELSIISPLHINKYWWSWSHPFMI
jgi:hypothetical protein